MLRGDRASIIIIIIVALHATQTTHNNAPSTWFPQHNVIQIACDHHQVSIYHTSWGLNSTYIQTKKHTLDSREKTRNFQGDRTASPIIYRTIIRPAVEKSVTIYYIYIRSFRCFASRSRPHDDALTIAYMRADISRAESNKFSAPRTNDHKSLK